MNTEAGAVTGDAPVERLVMCRGCGGEFDHMAFVIDSGLCAVCHDFMMHYIREAEKADRGDTTTVDTEEIGGWPCWE